VGVVSFAAGGVDLIVKRSPMRERVYCDGVLVSDTSLLVPRLVTTHRFSAGNPSVGFEVRTYEPGGWIVLRDGRVVASQPPGWGYVALFAIFAVLQWLDFAIDREVADAGIGTVSAALLTATLLIHLLWRRTVRGDEPTSAPSGGSSPDR
jgi:hypothetical protein